MKCVLYASKSEISSVSIGDNDNVEQLYQNICSDHRHVNVTTLSRSEQVERIFPAWDMDYLIFLN